MYRHIVISNKLSRNVKRYDITRMLSGSRRWYKNNFQDAMTLVRKFDAPDMFITVTCNPDWPEIKKALLPGQTKSERIDIITRVWRLYLEAIKRDIIENKAFGKTVANIKVMIYKTLC